MQNTTWSTTPALESITFDLLTYVNGGCGGGGHKRCCPQPAAPVQQTQIIQLPAHRPPHRHPCRQRRAVRVSTSVSINGQTQTA